MSTAAAAPLKSKYDESRLAQIPVELMFKAQNVEVASVRVVNQKGKTKRFGRSIGRRDHVKKAYVSLKEGQQLNFSGEAA